MNQTSLTSTQARGIYIRPRLPDFTFDESLPRNHTGSVGKTAFANMIGVFANVAERMFIRSGTLMQPLVEQRTYADELASFMAQEAYHSGVHERMNKVLRAKGYPIEEFRAFAQSVVEAVAEVAGHRMILAASLAGEQGIGVFGDALLEHPAVLDDWDDRVRGMFLWHAYEEVEHTAALFDSFHVAVNDPTTAYGLRMWGAAYLLAVLAASWTAGLFVFMEHEGAGEGFKPRNWRDIRAFFFGKQGVFSKSPGNLKAYLRQDFHPWDGRNAHELLERHQRYVRPEWDVSDKVQGRSPKRVRDEMSLETLRAPVSNLREAYYFTRFLLKVGGRTARFLLASAMRRFWRDDRVAYEARTSGAWPLTRPGGGPCPTTLGERG